MSKSYHIRSVRGSRTAGLMKRQHATVGCYLATMSKVHRKRGGTMSGVSPLCIPPNPTALPHWLPNKENLRGLTPLFSPQLFSRSSFLIHIDPPILDERNPGRLFEVFEFSF